MKTLTAAFPILPAVFIVFCLSNSAVAGDDVFTNNFNVTGKVGVGTATVATNTLDVAGAVGLTTTSTAPANGVYLSAANTLNFATNSNKIIEVTPSGFVGIGVSAPKTVLQVNRNTSASPALLSSNSIVQLVQQDGSGAFMEMQGYGPNGYLGSRTNGSAASPTTVLDTQTLVYLGGHGYNGTAMSSGHRGLIGIYGAGTWSTSSEPTYIGFWVTPVGSTTNAEAMRLTSAGKLGIGTSAPSATLDVNGTVRVGTFASASSTTVCQSGGVLSTCSSSIRFKENIKPSPLGLKEVLAMKPVVFDMKGRGENWEKHDFGFVAEDMEKISPLLVTYDASGETSGVRYMQLNAVNAKAIQELNDIIASQKVLIDQLSQRLERLESAR